jgi:hypothetical protein
MDSSELDRSPAELIPDEYVRLAGTPAVRVMELINRVWGQYAEQDKRQLGQALMAVLAPLNAAQPKVTPEIRAESLRAVNLWLGMHKKEPGR